MSNYYGVVWSDDHLEHHGVKGMQWGVKNEKDRYGDNRDQLVNKARKKKDIRKSTTGGKKIYRRDKAPSANVKKNVGVGINEMKKRNYALKKTKESKTLKGKAKNFVENLLNKK